MVYKYFYVKHEGGFLYPIYLPTHPKVLARRLPKMKTHHRLDFNTHDRASPRVCLRSGVHALAVFFPNYVVWDAIVKQHNPETKGWRKFREFKYRDYKKLCKRS